MMRLFSIFMNKSPNSLIENDDVDNLKTIIKNKEIANQSIVDQISGSKFSLIYAASYKKAYKCLCYLLKIGSDPDIYSYLCLREEYCTPLFLAVSSRNSSLTRLLMLHGANPDLPYKNKKRGKPRSAASKEMNAIIRANENLYYQLKQLNIRYDEKKQAADSAYKKNDFLLSKNLYKKAYNCRAQMKEIWQTALESEENLIIKSYYQEKVREQDESIKMLKTVADINESEDFALALSNLAAELGSLGDLQAQKQYLEQALVIQQTHYGENHLEVAKTLNNLAMVMQDLGSPQEAKRLLEQVLTIQQAHYGEQHIEVAKTLNNLAIVMDESSNYQTKKRLLEQALAIFQGNYGENHIEVAKTLENLANLLGALGNYQRQKLLLEQVLAIKKIHYSEDHVEITDTLCSLGTAMNALGDLKAQKQLLKRALRIQQAYYGENHVEVAKTLSSLASTLDSLGSHHAAKRYLKQALIILQEYYGESHVEVGKTLGSLGIALGNLGDHQTKKQYLEQALAIFKRYYSDDHIAVAITLEHLANAVGDLGDYQAKKQYLEQVLAAEEAHYGKEHVEVAGTLNNLGTVLGTLGNSQAAKDLLERALRIQKAHYGKEHAEVAKTLANLGMANKALGDIQEAMKYLQQALILMTSTSGYKDYKLLFIITHQLETLASEHPEDHQAVVLAAQQTSAVIAKPSLSMPALLAEADSPVKRKDAEFQAYVGHGCLRDNQPALALRYYERAMQLEPNTTDVYHNGPCCYDITGAIEQAYEAGSATILTASSSSSAIPAQDPRTGTSLIDYTKTMSVFSYHANLTFISQARDLHFNSPVFVRGVQYEPKKFLPPKDYLAKPQMPLAAPTVPLPAPAVLNHPSLSEIEISLRGLTLLRDSFEQLVQIAIPKTIDGEIKPVYQNVHQAAFRLLKNIDRILRALYDSYLTASKNPSDPHLTNATREMLLQQHDKLNNQIGRLQTVVNELPKPLPMAGIWNRCCNELSYVLIHPHSVNKDCQRDTLKRSYLQQYCEALARIPLRSQDEKKPTCFISYSWGFARHTMRVHTLASYLQAAGIDVRLDIWCNTVGSISIFLDQIDKLDFILVMGSEDLLEKWENKITSGVKERETNLVEINYKGHVVAEELSRIAVVMCRTPAKRQHVLSILLSGTQETSLPYAFRDLPTSALSLTNDSLLTTVACDLLKLLYRDYPEMQAPLEDYRRNFEVQIQTLADMTSEALAEEYERLTAQGHQKSSSSHLCV